MKPLRLNAPSGAGCSLTLPLGAAWLQRFQGLDRHRPCGALPEVAGTGPFLPPFVGMTPLATDGPGSGSGAGFGRDHAEKWQSRGVSHTTVAVTKTTSSVNLNPASTRTAPPPLARSPPAQVPVVEREHRPLPPTQDAHNKTDHVIGLLNTAPEQALIVDPFAWGRPDSRRSPSEYGSKATS